MEKTLFISALQKFRFGSQVFGSDGEAGVLANLIFERDMRRLTSIGVRQGRLFGKTVYLPFKVVQSATSASISLNVTRAELAAASVAVPGDALLDRRSIVQLADSAAHGTLILLAVQPDSGELAYLAVHHLRPGQDNLLVAEHVIAIDPTRILVSMTDATLQALPPYRSDEELLQEVENILFDLTPLHVDLKGMRIRVLDSVLYLDGNISSALRGDIVRDQAMGVEGLLQIENRLVGDDKLAGDLSLALAQDPRTRDLPIGIYPKLGAVRLSGSVHTSEQKSTAAEIASTFPGVRSVTNDLTVDPQNDMLHVMSAAEGGETEDKVPGKYVRHTK